MNRYPTINRRVVVNGCYAITDAVQCYANTFQTLFTQIHLSFKQLEEDRIAELEAIDATMLANAR